MKRIVVKPSGMPSGPHLRDRRRHHRHRRPRPSTRQRLGEVGSAVDLGKFMNQGRQAGSPATGAVRCIIGGTGAVTMPPVFRARR